MMKNDIMKVFWTNVDWHRKNKNMSWRAVTGNNMQVTSRNQYRNITLKTIQEIASALDIDDYAILFEELGD